MCYDQETIHVLDASRSVGVVEKLINPQARDKFVTENRALQRQLAESYAMRQSVELAPYEEVKGRRFTTDWTAAELLRRGAAPRRDRREDAACGALDTRRGTGGEDTIRGGRIVNFMNFRRSRGQMVHCTKRR